MRRRARTLLTVTAAVLAMLAAMVLAPSAASAADGATLTGVVTDVDGVPVPSASVRVGQGGPFQHSTITAADGSYRIEDIAEGDWVVRFSADGFLNQVLGQPDELGTPDLIAATPGASLTADATLHRPTPVTVSGRLADGFSRVPGDHIYSALSRWDVDRGEWTERRGEWASDETIQLAPGHYLFTVTYVGPDRSILRDRVSFESDIVEGIGAAHDVALTPDTPAPVRVTGTDRFGTAVAASKRVFAPGVPVVYVVNGLNYPDALGAGPAAAEEGGPVLLITPTAVPAVVRAELIRLRPQRIVILGGQPSVTTAVERQLAQLAPVQRIEGADRFATSRELATAVFDDDSGFEGWVFLVNGLNFPDGLSAGTAARQVHAPVILVNGTASTVDAATVQTLQALGAERIMVLGGDNSVSTGIETSLRATGLFQSVARAEGADRFETSAQVSMMFTDPYEAGSVYVASGLNFPDALAGAAAASAENAPLLLTPQHCMSGGALYMGRWTDTAQVVFLGGENMIGSAVERYPAC